MLSFYNQALFSSYFCLVMLYSNSCRKVTGSSNWQFLLFFFLKKHMLDYQRHQPLHTDRYCTQRTKQKQRSAHIQLLAKASTCCVIRRLHPLHTQIHTHALTHACWASRRHRYSADGANYRSGSGPRRSTSYHKRHQCFFHSLVWTPTQ